MTVSRAQANHGMLDAVVLSVIIFVTVGFGLKSFKCYSANLSAGATSIWSAISGGILAAFIAGLIAAHTNYGERTARRLHVIHSETKLVADGFTALGGH